MTTTINASPANGIVQTADGSGVMKLQSNGVTTNALAWVNFNGTGTVAIRSSYNVSSITDNGTGDYTINFATALSDANYAAVGSLRYTSASNASTTFNLGNAAGTPNPQTGSLRITTYNGVSGSRDDCDIVTVVVFGN